MSSASTSAVDAGRIEHQILMVRGQRVLLDRDLAALYGIETRVLNQAVRRNVARFPDDFMFPLTRDEIRGISQDVTSPGRATLRFSKSALAFTEQGVAMLSGVLNSPRAIEVNIAIMRAFVQLRRMISAHADLARKLAALERRYDRQFRAVFEAIRELMETPGGDSASGREIGFHTGRPGQRPAAGKRT